MTRHPGLETSDFLRACRGLPVERTPVWFMRQAGRSLPEYRKVREGIGMLDSCRRPDLVTEITLQPVRRYGVDAAIFFSDIVVPLAAAGVDLDIGPGIGPVVAEPVRTRPTSTGCRELTRATSRYVSEAVRLLVAELGPTPLIGFAGAPFTLASYLVEGGPSRDLRADQGADARRPGALAGRCWTGWPQITATFLRAQVDAGRRRGPALRLLGRGAVARATTPSTCCRTPPRCSSRSPRSASRGSISASGPASCSARWPRPGADVVGVDWRVPLDEAARRSAPAARCRATSTRPCCSRRGEVEAEGSRGSLAEGRAARRARVQPGPRRAAGRPTRTCWPRSSTWCTDRDA